MSSLCDPLSASVITSSKHMTQLSAWLSAAPVRSGKCLTVGVLMVSLIFTD